MAKTSVAAPARRAVVLAVLAMSLAGEASPRTRFEQALGEQQVKAAFLFNFTRFVAWPPAARPLAICAAGSPALVAAANELVRGRLVDGRAVVARSLPEAAAAEGCDLLYLGDLTADEASAVLSKVQGPVLTVGETPRFLRDGGMVRIFLDGNRMRFQVNRRKADAAGLKISSQLLSLASQ